jgi:hypothetical protein
VTSQLQSRLLAGRAVRKRVMIIGDFVEEVDLILVQQQTGRERVDRGVSPPLVEETPGLIEVVKVVEIGFRSEPVEVSNFKIGPLNQLNGGSIN